MFLSSTLPSVLLLPVAFWTPIHKHECDLNIEGGEGPNVILCYNICDRDCLTFIRNKSWDMTTLKLLSVLSWPKIELFYTSLGKNSILT